VTERRQTTLSEIEGDPPCCDLATLEGLAECVYAARRDDSAQGIAAGQGVEVDIDHGFPPGYDGIAVLDLLLLIVRPSRDGATLALRILHELAHVILQRLGWRHSHGDVWLLALAMAAPSSMIRAHRPHDALALAGLARLPAWAAAARLVMRESAAA